MKFTILDKIEYPLVLNKVIKYIPNERNNFDRRKKQSTVIVSYYDNNDIEYRKAYHNKSYTPIKDFIIPKLLSK